MKPCFLRSRQEAAAHLAVMRSLLAALSLALLPAVPASADTVANEVVVEEWTEPAAKRFVLPELAHASDAALSAYGPFQVFDETTAALVGVSLYFDKHRQG